MRVRAEEMSETGHPDPDTGRQLRRVTLAAQVYAELKHMMIIHTLTEGTQLNEVELGRALGVSPTPVREALNQLKGEGLVTSDPRVGTYVTRFTEEDVVQITDLRETLECKALQEAAPLLTPADLAALYAIHERYLDAYRRQPVDLLAAAQTNAAFHRFFARKRRNRWLMEMLDRLTNYLHLIRAPITEQSNGLISVQEHEAILQALSQGKAEDAVRALAAHLRRVARDLLAVRRAAIAGRDGASSR